MSVEKAAAGGAIDQRLAAALSGALAEGESVLAQEAGDQGQFIVLTNSRLIVVKIGLAATGEMDVVKTAAYDYASIASLRLRRGPLGAVIQIVSESAPPSAPGQPPMNLVIFSSEQRIRHAEKIAEHIGKALGIDVERIEPPHDASAHPALSQTPEHVAPAEPSTEADAQQAQPTSGSYDLGDLQRVHAEAEDTAEVTDKSASAAEVEDSDEAPSEEDLEFHPNPRLPRPVRSGVMSKGKVIALIGVLASLVVAGIAVLGPMHSEGIRAPERPARAQATTAGSIRADLETAVRFQADIRGIIAASDASAAALSKALTTRNLAAISTVVRTDPSKTAIDYLKSLTVPEKMERTRDKYAMAIDGRREAIALAEEYVSSGDSALIPIMQSRLIVAARLLEEAEGDASHDIADLKSRLAEFQAGGK